MNEIDYITNKSLLCDRVVIWIAFIVAIQPDFIISKTIGAQLINIASLLVFAVICITTIRKRFIEIDYVLVLIFLTLFSLVLSSLLNSANVGYALRRLMVIFSLCVIVNCNLKENIAVFLKTLHGILYLIVVINFFTMVFYPNGLYYSYYDYYGTQIAYLRHWFIGAGNNLILVYLPACLTNQIRLYRIEKTVDIRTICLWAMCLYGVLYTGAATSLIAIVAFIIFSILVERKNIKMPSLKTYTILGITIFILIVFLDIANVFSGLLGVLFNADVTFTGRTKTWATAISLIKEKPILGYGFEYATTMLNRFKDNTATHCHNLYLDLCYRSGITSLALFIATLFRCARPLNSYRNHRISVLLSFTIFLYLGVLFQMEAYFNMSMFYAILIFAANTGNIIKYCDKKEKIYDDICM